MTLKLKVVTQSHDKWPKKGDREAGESYNLVCQDMTQPANDRMTENVSYRLKEDEVPKYWDKALDKIIEVICRRMTTSKSGKVAMVGNIVEIAK